MPVYTGANAEQGAGGITVAKGGGKSIFIGAATFTTDDSVEQVTEFYKDKLGDQASIMYNGDGQGGVVFKIVSPETLRTITITKVGGSPTKITIANVAK